MKSAALPLVSAVITTHNRLELLPRAIESVRRQTYRNLELIVVDDASTDGTKDYCQSQDFTFIHIPKEESRGGNHARNVGVLAAKGIYVAFLDDDDYWLPEKIAKQVDLIEQSDCELVHCGKKVEMVKDGQITYHDALPNPQDQGDMSKRILTHIATITSLILVRRQALLDIGLFDENLRFWQEYDLSIRIAQRKPFYFVNEPLCVYRVDIKDKGRLTNKYFEWKEAVRYIHHKHRALYKQLNLRQRFQSWTMVQRDARGRSKAAGLTFRYAYLRLLCFTLELPGKMARFVRHPMVGSRKLVAKVKRRLFGQSS